MKKTVVLLFAFVLLVNLIGAVSAKMIKTQFTGVGGGYPIQEPVCTMPDGNLHCRGMVLLATTAMSDERLSGTETVTINWNFRPLPPPIVWTGPMWGSGQLVGADGYWDVKFTGERDEQGYGHLKYVAHGHGGYEGLKAFYTGLRASADEMAPFEFTGYILESDGD